MTDPNRALLLVEDETLIALELEDIAQELGYRVLGLAGTTARALELVSEFRDELDAAILDANLGGESSYPVAEALVLAGIPFIVTSGYEVRELRQRGFNAPHIPKPYGKADISVALDDLWARPDH